jgi:hypothetical protein
MGNLLNRAINYIFPHNEIIYSKELQIILPVTHNDIYQENKNDIIKQTNNENIDIVWII